MNFVFKEIISVTIILFSVIDILGAIPIIIDLRKKAGSIHAEQATLVAGGLMITYLFLGISLTAALRIAADIQAINTVYGFSLTIITVVSWITCMSLWVLRFAPLYLMTRLDGKAG